MPRAFLITNKRYEPTTPILTGDEQNQPNLAQQKSNQIFKGKN